MPDNYYVAETDESGKVAWLWTYEGRGRTARPVRRGTLTAERIDRDRVVGASFEAVSEWLDSIAPRLSGSSQG